MDGVYIVIPTYKEADNIQTIITTIFRLDSDFHVIIVDDNSPDATAEIAQTMNQLYGNIRVCRRPRKMGIGSAIRDGMKEALSYSDCKFVVTMDADMSHNPKDIPRLLAESGNAELVQGSRYAKGGRIVGWGPYRKLLSWTANFLYRLAFGLKQREVTTSFRVYSRKCAQIVVNRVKADKYEFAIASALIINDYGLRINEVPIEFVNRVQGKSKLKTADIIYSVRYLLLTFIVRLFNNVGFQPIIKFGIVGATGIGVNQGLLWLLTDKAGLYYLYSALISIEASIMSNFILNDSWTFRDVRVKGNNIGYRFLKYNLLCLAGAALNYVILWTFTDILHIHYLVSNLCGIVAAFIWNYLMSLKWAWSGKVNNKNSH